MADVTCPKCKSEFEVDLSPGSEFECGSCNAVVVVPLARGAQRAGAKAALRAGGGARRTAPAAAGKKLPMPLIVGGAVILLGILFYAVMSGDDAPTPTPPSVRPNSTPEPAKLPVEAPKPIRPTDPFEAARFDAQLDGATVTTIKTFANMAWDRAESARKDGNTSVETSLRRDAGEAYTAILKKEIDNAEARDRLGFVRFIKADVAALLDQPWMTKALKTSVEEVLEVVEEKLGAKLEDPVWISTRDTTVGQAAKDWKRLLPRITEREAAWKARGTDPFYKSAENLAAGVEADIGAKLRHPGVDGDCFKVFVEKPYVCLVQRDKIGGEDRIAERWLEMLQQLRVTFYARFGKPLDLAPMEKPTPVLVLRTDSDYTIYLRLGDSRAQVTSLAHYEPWSNRLVTWVEKDPNQLSKGERGMTEEEVRTTLFHEGTHQLIDFNTKNKSARVAMEQALWFSEGMADYFGGHGRNWNESNQAWDYEPGLINTERIDQLTSSKTRDNLIPLKDLLEYRRKNYVGEKEDPRNQLKVLNAYAQGWLLCYLLSNHNDGRDRAKFDQYVKLELSGQTGESTFKSVFGPDSVSRVETELRNLIDELGKAKKEERIVNGRLRAK